MEVVARHRGCGGETESATTLSVSKYHARNEFMKYGLNLNNGKVCGSMFTHRDVMEGYKSPGIESEARDRLESIPFEGDCLFKGGSAVIGPNARYITPPLFDKPSTITRTRPRKDKRGKPFSRHEWALLAPGRVSTRGR
jgi:hypothetical protein